MGGGISVSLGNSFHSDDNRTNTHSYKESGLKCWNAPSSSYHPDIYIHRQKYEEKLKKLLGTTPSNNLSKKVRVSGTARGIGKTTLALNYFFENKKNYAKSFWFNYNRLYQDYKQLGRELNLIVESIAHNELINTINQWFLNQSDWLIVYDDVPAYDSIVWPNGNGHIVLISTGSNPWHQINMSQIELSTMEEAQSCELIALMSKRKKEDIKSLANKLGHLPIALSQASAYLSHNPFQAVKDYIKMLEKHDPNLLKKDYLCNNKSNSIYATLAVNLEEIKQTPLAVEIANHMSCLNNVKISSGLLRFLLDDPRDDDFNAAIEVLRQYAIIACTPSEEEIPYLSIHSLVQDIHYQQNYLIECIKKLKNFYSDEPYLCKEINTLGLIPHFVKLIDRLATVEINEDLEEIVDLVFRLHVSISSYYIETYQLSEAENTLEKASQFKITVEKEGVSNEFRIIDLLCNSVRIYLLKGDYPKAHEVAITEMMPLVDENCINSKYFLVYAECLRAMGKNEQTIELLNNFADKNDRKKHEIAHILGDTYYDMKNIKFYQYYQSALEIIDNFLKEKDISEDYKKDYKNKLLDERMRISMKLGPNIFWFKLRDCFSESELDEKYKEANKYLIEAFKLYKEYLSENKQLIRIWESFILTNQAELDFQYYKIGLDNFPWKNKLRCLFLLLTETLGKLDKSFKLLQQLPKENKQLVFFKRVHISILNHYIVAFYTLAETFPILMLQTYFFNKGMHYNEEITKEIGFNPSDSQELSIEKHVLPFSPLYIIRHCDNVAMYHIIKGDYQKAIFAYQKNFQIYREIPSLRDRAFRSLTGIVLCCVRYGVVNNKLRGIWDDANPFLMQQHLRVHYKKYFNEIDVFLGKTPSKYSFFSLSKASLVASVLFCWFSKGSAVSATFLLMTLTHALNSTYPMIKKRLDNKKQRDLLNDKTYVLLKDFFNDFYSMGINYENEYSTLQKHSIFNGSKHTKEDLDQQIMTTNSESNNEKRACTLF